ncbi:GyrI-like domain-containing protein [Alicyclobacillus fodiniaquatilis]|uniref:GyrI-like domain-containing protein n=1 Tax=Alicyclobacillus fodiniaquatilis TaxID=1661150 RepID=A0ABW4JJX9_9BACL
MGYEGDGGFGMAAQELSIFHAKVLYVALKYGYDSPESFAKAFRKAHGISPSEARAQGVELKAYPRISFHLPLKGDQEMDYKIVSREGFTVIGKMWNVSCKDGENFRRIPEFWQQCHTDGTIERLCELSPGKDVLGICMDMNHDTEELTYGIGVEGQVNALEDGWAARDIPACNWAVFTSIGPLPHTLQAVWKRIFEAFFPATGYQHAGAPELEVYPLGDTTADDYRCEVWIPVVKNEQKIG